jgi:hypothetical protein
MLEYVVEVPVRISTMVNWEPGLLGVNRANAAARITSKVSGVWLRPKNELFLPERSGRKFPL